jgi:L-arabinokinase
VIADAPPLAAAAAAAAGVPAVVCANFTWDWIYGGYPGPLASAPDLIPAIQDAYRQAEGGWRLPMHGGFDAVAPVVDVPFVARHARADRSVDDVRRALRLPAGRRLALVSFGGYGVKDLPLDRLDCVPEWGVVIAGPAADVTTLPAGLIGLPEERIYAQNLRYEDLVRAVDVVVTKPGYGIISDCLANDTAMLFTSRGRFLEYDVLVAGIPRILRSRYLEMEALLAGRWRGALEALAASPAPPERPRTDGARVVAAMIAGRLNLDRRV